MNTKKVSYYFLKQEGKVKKMQDYLYHIIALFSFAGGKVSARDISRQTGLPINTVTGRINELRKMKRIYIGGVKFDDETKRNVNFYLVNWNSEYVNIYIKKRGYDVEKFKKNYLKKESDKNESKR